MIARAAQAAADRAIDRIERAAADALPGDVTAERTESGVRISGRGLARRWLADPDLRAFAILAGRRGG